LTSQQHYKNLQNKTKMKNSFVYTVFFIGYVQECWKVTLVELSY